MFVLDVQRKLLWVFSLFFALKINALGVTPTFVSLSPEAPVANLTLMNERDIPVTIQIEVVRWLQAAERDVYKPTDELILSPQIFKLAPRASQLVRIGLEEPVFATQEKTYRIFAQEVLSAPKEKINGVRIAFRVSVPLVIKTKTPVQQQLVWHSLIKGRQVTVVAQNKGNNLLFVGQLQAFSATHQAVTKAQSTFAYIVPGSKKTWTLNTLNTQKPRHIKALEYSRCIRQC
jgi:fimbrial chaperone protein